MAKHTALIIGASRGLGLALVRVYLQRGWHVVATVRGEPPAALGDGHGGRLRVERVDITQETEIDALRERLARERFDLVLANAAIATEDRDANAATVSDMEFIDVMVTNVLGPMRVLEAFESLVPASGVLAAMSSGLGSVENNTQGGWNVYRASKAALNQMLRSFANERAGDRRAVLALDPGWVRTDMGGHAATLSVDESIPRLVDAIASYAGKAGAHFVTYRGGTLPW
ncbi:SDR family NAD(P)-dependent oxidoreductase [Luteibacter yeojuensis]|nr:SDR family NAD(P)-dependent oxidoreductase [Luteibacter yeojuensis]